MGKSIIFTALVPMPETLKKGQIINFEDGPAKVTSINEVEWRSRFTVMVTGRCKKVSESESKTN